MTLPRVRVWIRLLASLALLGGLAAWLDVAAIVAEIERLSSAWVMLALTLTLPQVGVSAWRWRLTARLLDIHLAWRAALSDYYLATFLNQILPGGVMGDAARAWRHARASGVYAPALRAVIIERASGQLVLAAMAVLALFLPAWRQPLAIAPDGFDTLADATAHLWPAATLGIPVAGLLLARVIRRPPWILQGLGHDLYRSLLSASAWPRQMLGSLLVVASYVAVYACAARAIGVELPWVTLLALIPPILLAMAIPLSIAGWGLREGAAALVWAGAGLPPAQGVAVAVAYGALVLISSLPGAVFLLRRRSHRSRRHGGGQLEIEQPIVTAGEASGPGAQGLIKGLDGGQVEPRPPRADQQRRDQQVQPMQHAGLEKARHRHSAALDQHAPTPACNERLEHAAGSDTAAGVQRHGDALDVGAHRSAKVRRALAHQMQRRRLAGLEDMPLGADPATRVEYYPQRIAPAHMTYAELWIIRRDGAGADQHGIDQRPQAMQMGPALEPVHVMRSAGHGGDTPIQALTELSDGQRRGARH